MRYGKFLLKCIIDRFLSLPSSSFQESPILPIIKITQYMYIWVSGKNLRGRGPFKTGYIFTILNKLDFYRTVQTIFFNCCVGKSSNSISKVNGFSDTGSSEGSQYAAMYGWANASSTVILIHRTYMTIEVKSGYKVHYIKTSKVLLDDVALMIYLFPGSKESSLSNKSYAAGVASARGYNRDQDLRRFNGKLSKNARALGFKMNVVSSGEGVPSTSCIFWI